MTRPSAQKGKLFENYIADQIVEKGLDDKAKRSIGSGSGTKEKSDIDTSLKILGRNIGIEAKSHKIPHIKDWWEQTQELEKVGREPVLVYKLGSELMGEAKAVIFLDTLLLLIKKSQEEKTIKKELETTDKYKLERLKQSLNEVIKIFK